MRAVFCLDTSACVCNEIKVVFAAECNWSCTSTTNKQKMLWFRVQTALDKSIRVLSSTFKLLACPLTVAVLLLLPLLTHMNLHVHSVSNLGFI